VGKKLDEKRQLVWGAERERKRRRRTHGVVYLRELRISWMRRGHNRERVEEKEFKGEFEAAKTRYY
jgi:hypothetical protein